MPHGRDKPELRGWLGTLEQLELLELGQHIGGRLERSLSISKYFGENVHR